MIARSRSTPLVFKYPFDLKAVGRQLPPGEYRVLTEEELIEELSFPVYRRVSTVIFVPGASPSLSSVEMISIDPLDLKAALDRDKQTHQAASCGTGFPND